MVRHMKKQVVKAAIHPGIGIARVGNSDDFFVGPHVPWRVDGESINYRDSKRALKRQAAEFRIYGYDADGEVIEELTAHNCQITWFAEVANKKASWYQFEAAADKAPVQPANRRNPQVTTLRDKLNICPGVRSISGKDCSGRPEYRFDTGTCMDQPVDLGELRTDSHGRLRFLSGKGVSGTFQGDHTVVDDANNDGWYDDTCDGPVWAEVIIGKTKLLADPAWVVVAPPNYAPELVPIVTMYDQVLEGWDLYFNPNSGYDQAQNSLHFKNREPSFVEDILPIFLRFSDMQWVNSGFAATFGLGSPFDFTNHSFLARLADATSLQAPLRLQILHQFRNPKDTAVNQSGWPQIYGDVDSDETNPLTYFSVTQRQYEDLSKWAQGKFKNDWAGARSRVGNGIDLQPLDRQPSLLDRAALTYCLGGPFHPGCELPWIMRNNNIYRSFGRIRQKSDQTPEVDYGDQLTKDMATSTSGPLGEQAPGDITRWMAVPWQGDTASCDAGYTPDVDPYLPTYWPARVPNHVLTHADYQIFVNKSKPETARLAAFYRRVSWMRHLAQGWVPRMNEMVKRFPAQGIVIRKPGAKGLLGGGDVFVEDR